jgi:hypothetical protein
MLVFKLLIWDVSVKLIVILTKIKWQLGGKFGSADKSLEK